MNLWRLRRTVHVSWGIAVLCVGIVLGVIAAQYMPAVIFANIAWLIAGVVLAVLGLWRCKLYMLIALLLAGMCVGLWRGCILRAQLVPYDKIIGTTVKLTGKVSDDPERNERGAAVLRIEAQTVEGHELPGRLWVTVRDENSIKRGDTVTIKGQVRPGFGSFTASMYEANILHAQRAVPGDVGVQLRDWFAEKVRGVLPDIEASLGIGYLLGQRRDLPPELDDALKTAGLTHIVVASGYNLTILVRFSRRLFVKISKYLATLAAGSMIVGFVLITGFSPSMSRAGLVAGLSLLAWYYGRRFHPLVLLSFAAALTLVINPMFGWNDLGWQLSFLAFGGVLIMAPLLQAYFFGSSKPGAIRQILGETVAAQLATFPIIAAAFGTASNVAVVANLLVLPLVPLAMLLVFLCGLTAAFLPIAVTVLAMPTQWLLGYMVYVAEALAALPWAQVTVTIYSWMVIGMYAVLTYACFYMWRKTRVNLRNTNIVE